MFSIETVLLKVTNEWPWNVDNSLLNGVIFLDTWIMLFCWESLKLYGVSSQSLTWFLSYLSINEPLLMELNLISVI